MEVVAQAIVREDSQTGNVFQEKGVTHKYTRRPEEKQLMWRKT